MPVVILAVLVAGLFSGSAAADTRCCKKVGGPPQLPATGCRCTCPCSWASARSAPGSCSGAARARRS